MTYLPETFAGGTFNLPLKVAKVVRLFDSTTYEGEKLSIRKKLYTMGYFLDKIGIIWDKENIPEYIKLHGGLEEVK